jgi:hypothetical protein
VKLLLHGFTRFAVTLFVVLSTLSACSQDARVDPAAPVVGVSGAINTFDQKPIAVSVSDKAPEELSDRRMLIRIGTPVRILAQEDEFVRIELPPAPSIDLTYAGKSTLNKWSEHDSKDAKVLAASVHANPVAVWVRRYALCTYGELHRRLKDGQLPDAVSIYYFVGAQDVTYASTGAAATAVPTFARHGISIVANGELVPPDFNWYDRSMVGKSFKIGDAMVSIQSPMLVYLPKDAKAHKRLPVWGD